MTFTPDQMKTWMDTRAYGNSMWSPPYIDSRAASRRPLDRRRRSSASPAPTCCAAVASDGALFTYDNVTVTVTP